MATAPVRRTGTTLAPLLLRSNANRQSSNAASFLARPQPTARTTIPTAQHLNIPTIPLPRYPVRWFSDKATVDAQTDNTEETIMKGNSETNEATAENGAEEENAVSKEAELEAQVKDLKNQLLRSLAEQENTRRIAKQDVESAKNFAIKSFAKSLLDVSDNLTLALQSVPKEEATDKQANPTLATLYEGIQMTDRGLMKVLESNGLRRYGVEGEPFDPSKHQALYQYEDEFKEAGTIGQVMKPGFLLHNRVLRPAEVGVVKKSG